MMQEIQTLFANTPIKALKTSTFDNLSYNLDEERIVTTEEGYLRNWKGLAELIGLEDILVGKLFKAASESKHKSPTKIFLEYWQSQHDSTILQLLKYLEILGRYDAIDDVYDLLIRDAKAFSNKVKQFPNSENTSRSISSQGTLESFASVYSQETSSTIVSESSCLLSGPILTIRDTIENLASYDAFVCNTYADNPFVMELIDNLEKKENLRLCIPERDVMPGLIELSAHIDIIRTRCRRMIIVVSPAFLNSPQQSFLTTMAQVISVDDRKRIVIPIIYKYCSLPPTLHALSKLDYTRGDQFNCFWGRLIASLRCETDPSRYLSSSSLTTLSDSPSPSSVSQSPPVFYTNGVISYSDNYINKSYENTSSGYSSISGPLNFQKSISCENDIHNMQNDANIKYSSDALGSDKNDKTNQKKLKHLVMPQDADNSSDGLAKHHSKSGKSSSRPLKKLTKKLTKLSTIF